MFDIESVKAEWKLTDVDDATLGHYGKLIFDMLCQGKTIKEIAHKIFDQDHDLVTPFELAFAQRYSNESDAWDKQHRDQEAKAMN